MTGSQVSTLEVLSSLSVAGSLSMGLPVDHGARVAVLSDRVARATGNDALACGAAVVTALLRWAGCTANAQGFAEILGDDVHGRTALVTAGPQAFTIRQQSRLLTESATLSRAHCEVAQRLAQRLHVTPAVIHALGAVFEQWDGEGFPDGVAGEHLPPAQRVVAIASDLEIMLRNVGGAAARRNLLRMAGRRHDPHLVDLVADLLPDLMAELDSVDVWDLLLTTAAGHGVRRGHLPAADALLVLADFADLKLPWNLGLSRRAARCATLVAERLSDPEAAETARASALLHGLGRVAISNSLWQLPRRLHRGEWDQVRLVPYHTERCLAPAPSLGATCRAAGLTFERLDGSGYFRGLTAARLNPEARAVQAAVAATAMLTRRPWRSALTPAQATEELIVEVQAGRLDAQAVEAVGQTINLNLAVPHRSGDLTRREQQVLALVAEGHTNARIAERLVVSPKTISRHLENVYRKLGVRSRAAATLAAVERGLV